MTIMNKTLFILSLFLSASAFSQESPFLPVQNLFAAMSAVDHTKMKATVTDDFQLLEVGEVWDMAMLIAVVKPSEYQRRNYFSVISSQLSGEMAWVSYWNKATFTKDELIETVVWLESAVMVKSESGWKIQMLHSTKIKPENLPIDIELTEYTK